MSKKLVMILVVISMVSMMVSLAASPYPGKAVRLVNKIIVRDQLQLSYDVFGYGKTMPYMASFTVDQTAYTMSCSYDGYKHVFCKSVDGARSFKGKPVSLHLVGGTIYTKFPGK